MRAALWHYATGIRLSHSRSLFTMIILVFVLSSIFYTPIILSIRLKIDTLNVMLLAQNYTKLYDDFTLSQGPLEAERHVF